METTAAKKWIVGIALTAIALFLIFNSLLSLMQPVFRFIYKEQISVIDEFIGALHVNDGGRISAKLTPDVLPFQQKKAHVEQAGELVKSTDIKTMKILGVYSDSLNGKNYCLIHVHFDNDRRKEIGFRLIKDGQRWLIDAVSILDGGS